jgi:hypothetical protein
MGRRGKENEGEKGKREEGRRGETKEERRGGGGGVGVGGRRKGGEERHFGAADGPVLQGGLSECAEDVQA